MYCMLRYVTMLNFYFTFWHNNSQHYHIITNKYRHVDSTRAGHH
jgi:hypothetical protein